MRGRSRLVGLAIALCAAAGASGAGAAAASARDGYVTSFDGTKIVYSFFPAPNLAAGRRAPTVMVGPGYSSARSNASDPEVAALLAAGYNVLTWDPRGFGDSGGNVEIDSPDYEARDVSALIDYIAQQPEAQLDGSTDPHLGMAGASYGGGIQNTSAATDRRIDVITPDIAWHSLVTSLDKNDTAKGGWGTVLYGGGQSQSMTAGITGGLTNQPAGFQTGRSQDPRATTAFTNGLATGRFTEADKAFFASRGPGDLVNAIRVPTLITQGTVDTLFTLHEGIQNYAAARAAGVPTQMIWFCGGHGACFTSQGPDPDIVLSATLRWLARYLKGDTSVNTGPRFEWVSDTGTLHGAPDYPLTQGTPLVATGSGTLPLVPGDTSGALIAALPAANAVNVPLPAVAGPAELVGEPTLTLTYTGTGAPADDRVYAQIVDVTSGRVLGNQVTPVPVVLDGAQHTVTLPIEGIAVDATPQSSYALQIADGSNVYFAQRSAGVLNLAQIRLSVPTAGADASSVLAAAPASGGGSSACAASTTTLLRLRRTPRLRSAVVYAGTRRLATLHGARLRRPLPIALPASAALHVRVVERTRSGRLIVTRRTYRRCAATRTSRRFGAQRRARAQPRFTG